jgi:hypothetical protein
MSEYLHKKLMILAITLLDKQDGMDIVEWNLLRGVLEEERTHDAREIMENVVTVKERVFLDEEWVEQNYHKFE